MGEVEEDGLAGSQMDKEKLDQIVSKLERSMKAAFKSVSDCHISG